MKLILISYQGNYENEISILHQLFASGLEILHLRKPACSNTRLKEFILQINQAYRNKIVLHNHHHLAKELGLKGVHFNSDATDNRAEVSPDEFQKSASCHSFEQVRLNHALGMNYVFLSPVFDSISKKGYYSHFSEIELHAFLTTQKQYETIALGGVEEENMHKCKEMGFAGVAVMGAVWSSKNPVKAYINCQLVMNNWS